MNRHTVIAADGLYKRDVFSALSNNPKPLSCLELLIACLSGFPDPFAVVTVNGEQTQTTQVSKRTLNPYWNESFDLYVSCYSHPQALDQDMR